MVEDQVSLYFSFFWANEKEQVFPLLFLGEDGLVRTFLVSHLFFLEEIKDLALFKNFLGEENPTVNRPFNFGGKSSFFLPVKIRGAPKLSFLETKEVFYLGWLLLPSSFFLPLPVVVYVPHRLGWVKMAPAR